MPRGVRFVTDGEQWTSRVKHDPDSSRLGKVEHEDKCRKTLEYHFIDQATMKEFDALNRVTFGPKPEERTHLAKIGWEAYIKEQLAPGPEPEELQRMIREDSFPWQVDFGQEDSVADQRLKLYFTSIQEIYNRLNDRIGAAKYDKRRPYYETIIITWLKALHSPWQLRELMVEFWHNHFNVSVDIEDQVAIAFAVYDRTVIRPNVFGNFRTMLEGVAKSPSMLLYLDNAFNRAGPANENYARELFELHTLGEDRYYNHLFDEWREVPGALEGKAEGYIDEDVYEAARAFTGWTVAINEREKVLKGPENGDFYYYDQWHDHYQKRILGVEFESHQAPMADGLKVLDMLANHPGTAEFVCTKICRWLVADDPPKSVVNQAVKTWMAHRDAPDQLGKVLQTILLSEEFAKNLGTKIKRPNHLPISYIRMTGSHLQPHQGIFWWIRAMGYHQFSSPFPTGNPDGAEHWLNTDGMLKRWQTLPMLQYFGEANLFQCNVMRELPEPCNTFDALVDFWTFRLWNGTLQPDIREELRSVFFEELGDMSYEKFKNTFPKEYEFKVRQTVHLLAMSPDFQKR